jgi:hypothetical protein
MLELSNANRFEESPNNCRNMHVPPVIDSHDVDSIDQPVQLDSSPRHGLHLFVMDILLVTDQ